MKYGILGGTFDPFTDAHSAIVRKVLEEKLVDRVIVIPTVVSYYRDSDDRWLDDNERKNVIAHRVAELVEKGYDVVCTFAELETLREHPSLQKAWRKGRRFYYTLINVYSAIREEDAQFYTIIGSDQYKNFKTWFMWRDILSLTKLIVANGRNGDVVPLDSEVPCTPIAIDPDLAYMSATEIRKQYKGTEDAITRFLERKPPLDSRLLCHTPIFDVVEKREVQPGFRPVGIVAPDWVTVVIRHKDRYLMARQLRYGTMLAYDEFVCGQVENGEEPEAAARREMQEETGICSWQKFAYLGKCYTNPAFMNNKMHFFYAEVNDADVEAMKPQSLDEHERIELEWKDCSSPFSGNCNPAFMIIARALAEKFFQMEEAK